MIDGRDASDCPRCGQSLVSMTVVGLGEAVVAPCGHWIAPQAVTDHRE